MMNMEQFCTRWHKIPKTLPATALIRSKSILKKQLETSIFQFKFPHEQMSTHSWSPMPCPSCQWAYVQCLWGHADTTTMWPFLQAFVEVRIKLILTHAFWSCLKLSVFPWGCLGPLMRLQATNSNSLLKAQDLTKGQGAHHHVGPQQQASKIVAWLIKLDEVGSSKAPSKKTRLCSRQV